MSLTRLDDAQYAQFLQDGFIVLQPADLDAAFHEHMFASASLLHDEANALGGDSAHLQIIGDNLRARIPAGRGVAGRRHGSRGALKSILGEDYLLHPHHFVHEAKDVDQGFHQDGNLPWNDRGHYRTHRPNWAMLFYYPQAVVEDNGPTDVVAGSQYWTVDYEADNEDGWRRGDRIDGSVKPEELSQPELDARDARLAASLDTLGIENLKRRRVVVPAGSVVVAHYDLIHRGSRKLPGLNQRRFMFKFYFMRTRDPLAPAWDNHAEEPVLDPDHAQIHGVVRRIWHWSRGDRDWHGEADAESVATPSKAAAALAKAAAALIDATAEDERVAAAYRVGATLAQNALLAGQVDSLLGHERESVRRAAGHALGIAGEAGSAHVMEALRDPDPKVRRAGVFAAGAARLPEAVEGLLELLETDADDLVRSNAAYALGNIARTAAPIDVQRVLARLSPAAEPDNTTNGNMTRSTVRESVIYTLIQIAANRGLSDAELDQLAALGLADHDRYVRGLTLEVLAHAAPTQRPWMATLLRELAASRFSERPKRPSAA